MDYIQIHLRCPAGLTDLLMAELSQQGFDAFLYDEDEAGFTASVEEASFDEPALQDTLTHYQAGGADIRYGQQTVARQNWNKLWEKNYPYVVINDDCAIRADFHTLPRPFRYELIINPKMSFGTGHHATTTLMLWEQMNYPPEGKLVLEAGCGTGILSIMAMKQGALRVDACEIEDWSVENARENAVINRVHITVKEGTVAVFPPEPTYDVLLANINKNVILAEMKDYARRLKPEGRLITSGFYEHDLPEIIESARQWGFQEENRQVKDQWAVVRLRCSPRFS